MMALGFHVIYASTRVFHLAHASVFAVGGYSMYALLTVATMPRWTAGLLAIVLAAFAGLAIDSGVYRPLERRSATGSVLLLSSLATHLIVVSVVAILFGNEVKAVLGPTRQLSMLGFEGPRGFKLYAAIAATVLLLFVRRTSIGLAWRAASESPTLAATLGLNVDRVRSIAVAVGSSLAGLAGALAMLDVGILPDSGFHLLLAGLVAYVLAGARGFAGTALAAIGLSVLEDAVGWFFSARWEPAVVYSLLLLILIAPSWRGRSDDSPLVAARWPT